MYKRAEYQLITERLKEPRRFIQVVMGARQIGKSTVVKQVLKDGSSDIWSDSMLKKKTAEQFVYLNNDKQMYSYEQQFSISCLGFV